ncbi:guanylate cyclase [Stutzerimonas stutzeri]|uniref:Guanylate cyclase n=1 Tax=Stutzerimonas stutzeri TaxID=316 RepID=W8RPH1_STUST|nr:adenylate/guanylate cyclase domain-containing protein [Stutzerimonas stutzeri]AHL73931.1 guanylate cyclase [Stutzerimonas stutzeri]MCQ4328547.1 adenylate/guanylate cyclase domain-containing protein [Stutzerimonas stutzeri]
MTLSGRLVPRLLLACAGLVAACALYIGEPALLQTLRNNLFDQYQRWQPRPAPTQTNVLVLDIDEDSLSRLGQWPWPRDLMAQLLERLRQAGVAVVVFDVLFAEPDRSSPAQLRDQLPAELADQLEQLPDHDRQFAAALRRQPSVLGFAATRIPYKATPQNRFAVQLRADAGMPGFPDYAGTATALPVLEAAAAGSGAMTFQPDGDGVVRRVPLMIRVGEHLLPSLSAEAMRVYLQQGIYRVDADARGSIAQVGIGRVQLPTNRRGELWVHYRAEMSSQTLPAWQLLQDEPDARLQGAIVLVGSSAQGLQDLRFSPLGGIMPGVEVHAQAIEQALFGTPLQRPYWASPLEALTLLLAAILLCIVTLGTGALTGALVSAGLLTSLNLAAWWLYSRHGFLFDALTPSLGLILAYLGASIARHRASERQQRWVRDAFSRYISPNLVEYLVRHPEQLQLGGERRACSFVFTDLTGSTNLMEEQSPERLVSMLNEYLEGIIQIAFRHHGTLERIMGDGLAILFSAPLVQADHQRRALACALEIRQFTRQHAVNQHASGVELGCTRIGVHSGEVVVGNFGGSTLFDYRALGDAVNVAARLEGLNRHLGTELCVSETIRDANQEVPMRPIGNVQLKGKGQPIRLYEPGEMQNDDAYDAAYALIANGDEAAVEAFERLHAQRPDDALVRYQLERLCAGQLGEHIVMSEK